MHECKFRSVWEKSVMVCSLYAYRGIYDIFMGVSAVCNGFAAFMRNYYSRQERTLCTVV